MTGKASPNETPGGADPGGADPGGSDVARFLQDWGALWRDELRALANDPDSLLAGLNPDGTLAGLTGGVPSPASAAILETWRSAMVVWAEALGFPLSPGAAPGDPADATEGLGTRADAAGERGARATGSLPSRVPAPVAGGSRAASARAETAAAAPDPRDAEIERLARRVDELEARLARLEAPGRPRARARGAGNRG